MAPEIQALLLLLLLPLLSFHYYFLRGEASLRNSGSTGSAARIPERRVGR